MANNRDDVFLVIKLYTSTFSSLVESVEPQASKNKTFHYNFRNYVLNAYRTYYYNITVNRVLQTSADLAVRELCAFLLFENR